MSFHDKKYLLDNEPVSARELIDAASHIDDEYAADCIKQTSVAARILRANGQDVRDNPDRPA
ncbi:MAG: hypothetical protein VX529_10395 [Pseudomonadota bacterium]|nr:hypothetical protein [Pseudomonadota bacterium]